MSKKKDIIFFRLSNDVRMIIDPEFSGNRICDRSFTTPEIFSIFCDQQVISFISVII